MNKIAVQTLGIASRPDLESGYRRIRDWGFDAADANIHVVLSKGSVLRRNIPDVLVKGGKDCMDLFRPWGEAARQTGIENVLAHAPFPVWLPFLKEVNQELIEVLKNTIRGCDLIGCRKLVIHPFYAGPAFRIVRRIDLRRNLCNFAKLILVAKEYGVMICLENVFSRTFTKRLVVGGCGDPKVAARYVDDLNALAGEKLFGFCFDTGHAHVCRVDIKEALITLGERVEALHIHDNNGISDQHYAPYMGSIDWNDFMEGLKAIRYKGPISFETYNATNKIPESLIDSEMRFINECGRMFAQRIWD